MRRRNYRDYRGRAMTCAHSRTKELDSNDHTLVEHIRFGTLSVSLPRGFSGGMWIL